MRIDWTEYAKDALAAVVLVGVVYVVLVLGAAA